MNCPNCWRPITDEEIRYCPECGVSIHDWGEGAVSASLATAILRTGNTLVLSHSPLTIGRDERNDICLSHPAVSEFHASLSWDADQRTWVLVDNGSARGSFVNYRPVPADTGVPVQPGQDVLWIAPYAFRLAISGESGRFEPAQLRLDAHGLRRTVKHPSGKGDLTILNLKQTALSFRPGEFIALVGGSGAGKSTLMKALLGLEPAQQGAVYLGATPFIEEGEVQRFAAMQTVIGYVPQEDVVHRELTVEEALAYTTRLRLSPDLSATEHAQVIDKTLALMELEPHRRKLIRQLSGGQRKRVNIALELLAQPRLLFLDEPTSGLDPGLDLAVMELLRDWAIQADDPRTIILVTHATENVTKCKYVCFMAPGGEIAYFGPPEQALVYFGVTRFAEIYRQINLWHEAAEAGEEPSLSERFQASRAYFQYISARQLEISAETDFRPDAVQGKRRPTKQRWVRFRRQLGMLTRRYGKLIRRDRSSFLLLLFQGLLVAGLLLGVSEPDTFQTKGAENAQTVLFILACACAWLGILNGTKEIVKEQDIYARERRYGLDAAAYVLAKLIVLMGIGLFQIVTLLLLLSYRVPFPASGALGSGSPLWFEWLITLWLTLSAGLALGLFLSAHSRTVDAATAVMFVLLLLQVMFAGIFFEDAAWAGYLSTLTFSRWGLSGLGVSADLNGLLSSALGGSYIADPDYLYSPWRLLLYWSVLAGFVAVLSSLAVHKQAQK